MSTTSLHLYARLMGLSLKVVLSLKIHYHYSRIVSWILIIFSKCFYGITPIPTPTPDMYIYNAQVRLFQLNRMSLKVVLSLKIHYHYFRIVSWILIVFQNATVSPPCPLPPLIYIYNAQVRLFQLNRMLLKVVLSLKIHYYYFRIVSWILIVFQTAFTVSPPPHSHPSYITPR